MAGEKRFVYKISAEAEYKGDQELAQLRADLKKVGEVKAYEKVAAGWKKTRAELAEARIKAKELHVELKKGGGADTAKAFAAANKEVSRLTASLDKQKGALLAATAAQKQNGIAIRDTAGAYKTLEAAATAQATKIAAVNKLGIRTSADILADIKAREKAYNDLKASGVVDIQTLTRAEKALQKQTSALKDELEGIGDKGPGIKDAAVGIAGGIASIGIASKGLEAKEFFQGFEDNLLATKALTGASEEQFIQLKEAAYKMADGSAGPEALAAGFAELATSGADVNEILGTSGTVKLLTSASRGAFDFKTAGDTLTNTIKVFGLELKDNVKVGDTLVKGWTSAGQEANELGEALVRAGGRFSKTYENLSKVARLQKATAVISALAEVGYKGSEGATALNGALRQLIKPGDEARQVLEKYKDTIKVFDETGNVRDFADIIDDVQRAGLDARESMALFGDEAGKAMPALVAQGGDFIRGFEEKIKAADGSMQQIAATMQGKMGGATRNMQAQFGVLAAKMVDSVGPAIIAVENAITKVVTVISDLPAPVLAAGVAFAGLATAGAAVVSALATWSVVGPSVMVAIGTIKAGTLALSAGLGTLRVAIGATVASMGALGTASVALAGAWGVVKIVQAVDAYKQMRDAQKMAAESVKNNQEQQQKYQDRLARVSEALGRQVTSYKDVQAAYESGELAYNKETDAYSKGTGVRLEAIESVASARKKALHMEEGELDKVVKLFDSYIDKIKEVDKAIKDVAAGGASDLFELSLVGKSEQETWNAWRDSARGLGEQIKQTVAEAKQFAATGNIDKANEKFAEAVELGKTMQSQYKGLATVVKNEFGPAQEEALKASKKNVQQLAKEGTKALSEYNKALSKLQSTTQALDAAYRELADAQRENAQSSMDAAAAYKDQAEYADKLAEESGKAAAAGDFDRAIETARQAKEAYKELESSARDLEQSKRDEIEKTKDKEIAALEQRKLTTEESARERERIERAAQEKIAALSAAKTGEQASKAGIEKSLQAEVDALEKKKAAEEKAAEDAKKRSDELVAAKQAEMDKVKALEEEKAGIAQTAEESAKVAQEGVKEAVTLVNEALESQKTILEEITKNLDENTGGAIAELKNQAEEFSEKWTAGAKQMGDDVVEQAERASRALDETARERTAVINVQTTEARRFGGIIGNVTAMRTGGRYSPPRDARAGIYFSGYGGGDTWKNHVIAEDGEVMLRKEAVRGAGVDAALAFNRKDFVGVVRKLSMRVPDVQNMLGSLSLPALPRLDAAQADKNSGPGNLPGIELHEMATGKRESIFSTPTGLEMVTRGLARAYRLKSSGV